MRLSAGQLSHSAAALCCWLLLVLALTVQAETVSEEQPEHPAGLFLLADPPNSTVDIVAVHGLDGHWKRSWLAENGVFWLQDLLPQVIPQARIYSFGYDSRTRGSSFPLTLDITEGGKELVAELTLERELTHTEAKPIMFIGHSLGGLVVKSALLHSDMARVGHRESEKSIKLSTFAILYFGTPHQGGQGVGLAKIVARVSSAIAHTNRKLLDQIELHSEWLQDLQSHFNSIINDFTTVFFYETWEMPIPLIGRLLVVPKFSAVIPGAANSEDVALAADHSSMVKYSGPNDPGFSKVSKRLKVLVARARTQVLQNWREWHDLRAAKLSRASLNPERLHQQPKEFSLGLTFNEMRNPRFTGREAVLLELDDIARRPARTTGSNVVVLYGIGGIGKTQIALEYAYRSRESYGSILWIDGRDSAAASLSLRRCLEAVKQHYEAVGLADNPHYKLVGEALDHRNGTAHPEYEQHLRETLIRWLSLDGNRSWLLVIDNVDEPRSFNFRSIVPSKVSWGSVLVTSRRADLAISWPSIEVGDLDEDEALDLLQQSTGIALQEETDEWKSASQLVQILSYFPLAIAQAGAYVSMHREHPPIASYLALYLQYPRYLLGHQCMQGVWDSPAKRDSVLTTWEISFDAVRNQNPEAAGLLLICGFLDRTNIDMDLFVQGSPRRHGSSTAAQKPRELEVREALGLLRAYSFLKESAVRGRYSMHPIVHLWARIRLSVDDQKKVYRDSLLMLFEYFRQATLPRGKLRPHVMQLYHFSQDMDPCLFDLEPVPHAPPAQSVARASAVPAALDRLLWRIIGCVWRIRGETTTAIRFVHRWYRGPAGMDDWELLYEMQRVPEGQDTVNLVAWVLCQARRSLPPKHLHVLEIVGNYGYALYQANVTDGPTGSLAWYRWLLDARSQVLGRSHPATAGALLGLGLSLIRQDKTSCGDGVAYVLEAFHIRKSALGLTDTLTVNALRNLAVAAQQCPGNPVTAKALRELLIYAFTEGGEKAWVIVAHQPVHSVIVWLIRNIVRQGRGACGALHLFRYYDIGWSGVLKSGLRWGSLSGAASTHFPPTWGSVDGFLGSLNTLLQIHVSAFPLENLCELARAASLQCIWESIAHSAHRVGPEGLTGWPVVRWSKPCPRLKKIEFRPVGDDMGPQAYRDKYGTPPVTVNIAGEKLPALVSFSMDQIHDESRSLHARRAMQTVEDVLDTVHALVEKPWKPEDVDTMDLAEMPMFYEMALYDPAIGSESVLIDLDFNLEEQALVGRDVLDFWLASRCPGRKLADSLAAVVESWDEELRASRSCFSKQNPRLWTMCPAA